MARRLQDFLADVAQSGLVAKEVLKEATNELGPGITDSDDASVRLARHLIARGDITSYQGRKLLAGVTRGFFLADYRILRRLGEGGMGKVYLAQHETTRERFAIKVLPPKKALESDQAIARFKREMELSQRVRHPNIARTLQVGEVDSVHYMVMEYILGDSLYNIIKHPKRGGPLRVTDATRFFLKVLDGLAAAHDAGVVHRDLKPSNLMITPDGDAKILDLGLARAIGDAHPLTRPNTVLGTLDYASPEQLSDAASADARSDLYSLGCTLYFVLSGRAPFEGGDIVNKIFKQRMEDPEPLERISKSVPAAYSAIVKKLMAKEPLDRYQSARELRADLAKWTDPSRLKAILGAEEEAAKAFRPPPPELDDDDLRLLDAEGASSPSLFSIRELGDGEPGPAPRHRPPPPPRPAVPLSTPNSSLGPLPPQVRPAHRDENDSSWLVPFIAIVCGIGILAIILLSLFR